MSKREGALQNTKLAVVAHACHPSAQRQGSPGNQEALKATLGYMRSYLKKTKKKEFYKLNLGGFFRRNL